jgi:hypothetical protein
VQSISFAEALEGTASARGGRFGGLREVLAYTYTQGPVNLSLDVERRKPFITARQLLLATVESGVIRYEASLFFDVRYSGVKSLRLDVPAELAAEMHNQTRSVAREATLDPQPDDVAEGYVAWSLTGETEFLGEVRIKFDWEKQIGELAVGKSQEEVLPRLRPENVDRAWGQIVITKAETLDVWPAGETLGLRGIDPQRDLMPGVQVDDAARAYEFHDEWSLTLAITRYELIEVKRTSIERAVIRMEVTRSDEISVQALYRMRSARQRLPIMLPAEVKFDTDPLRINGKSVPLERGDQDEYFVPLAGRNTKDPFLLEVRYTTPGDQRRLDLPEFPSKPAVQKVYLCAYVPQELAVLGSRGPWTDEMSWRWFEVLSDLPHPQKSDAELVAWLIKGLSVTDPTQDFATDGRLYTFSTLQPAPPPDGSARLLTVNRNVLNVLIVIPVLIIGLLVTRRPVPQKLAVVMLLVVLLLIAGLFTPTFSRQLLGGALLTAVLIVLAVWVIWHAARAWSALKAAYAARQAARQQRAQEQQTAEADSGDEAAADDAAEPTGETPFAGAQSSRPGGQPTPDNQDDASAGNEQEGGRSDA